jgi:peptide/nickel transport system substrate-binding protein
MNQPLLSLIVILGLFIAACAPTNPGSTGGAASGSGPSVPSGPKRITAALAGAPPTLNTQINPTAPSIPGHNELEQLVNSGLTLVDDKGTLLGLLAHEIPTVENGHWRVAADGRMETTWRLRSTARWHDGHPFTAEDVLFTIDVRRDREIPSRPEPAFAFVESVTAPDPHTVHLAWTRPYIYADSLFTVPSILPKHLLERPFEENKAGFLNLPYWTEEFVGTGPYRLQEWIGGSQAVVVANDQYVLGKPTIDEI